MSMREGDHEIVDFRPPQYPVPLLPELSEDRPLHRVGKKAAGRLLDGREWNEVPA
jgi:hypothetical protein